MSLTATTDVDFAAYPSKLPVRIKETPILPRMPLVRWLLIIPHCLLTWVVSKRRSATSRLTSTLPTYLDLLDQALHELRASASLLPAGSAGDGDHLAGFLDMKPERSPRGMETGNPVDPRVKASMMYHPQMAVMNANAPPALRRVVGSRPSLILKYAAARRKNAMSRAKKRATKTILVRRDPSMLEGMTRRSQWWVRQHGIYC